MTHPLASFKTGTSRNSRYCTRYYLGVYRITTPDGLSVTYRPTVVPHVGNSLHVHVEMHNAR